METIDGEGGGGERVVICPLYEILTGWSHQGV